MKMSATDRIVSLEASLAELTAKNVLLEKEVANQKSYYNSQSSVLKDAQDKLEMAETIIDAIPGALPRQKAGGDSWEKNPLAVRLVSVILALKGQ